MYLLSKQIKQNNSYIVIRIDNKTDKLFFFHLITVN